MSNEQRKAMQRALERNVSEDTPVYMDPKTTRFTEEPVSEEDRVINAIRSVPCHYSTRLELLADSGVCNTYVARITGRDARWFFRPPVPA